MYTWAEERSKTCKYNKKHSAENESERSSTDTVVSERGDSDTNMYRRKTNKMSQHTAWTSLNLQKIFTGSAGGIRTKIYIFDKKSND